MSYLHGIEIKEGAKRANFAVGDTSIIALVGTAPKGAVGEVKLITSAEAAVAEYGKDILGFTIPAALEVIFSHVSAKVLVCNVLGSEKAAALIDEGGKMLRSETGVFVSHIYEASLPQAVDYTADIISAIGGLLTLDDKLDVKPNVIIAPGYSQLAVIANKMQEAAEKLQGYAVIDIVADNVQAALEARASGAYNTVSSAVVLCYPQALRYNVNEQCNDVIGLSCYWAAAKVLRDAMYGFWLSPSNTQLNGVMALTTAISSSLTDSSADTNLLNGQGIVTIFRKSGRGTRLWGNWTAAFPSDKTTLNMVAARAVRMAIREVLIDASLTYMDKTVTPIVVDMITNDVNTFIRGLIGKGAIIDGACFYDQSKNSTEETAQGNYVFSLYIRYAASLERLTFEEVLELNK